jgi:polysaccharide biosynthesis transport protein
MSKDSSEKSEKKRPEGGGYGYSYGGSYAGYSAVGYGYGYGDGGGGGQIQRSLQDYLLILRERIWYVVVVFLVVFSSALVFTLSQPKIYESVATVQIFRRDPTIMPGGPSINDTDIRGPDDLNTQVKVLESVNIIQHVAERITGEDLRLFLAPYDRATADVGFVSEILAKNRKVIPQRLTFIVAVSYDHQDRFVAAKIANLFVDEYLTHNTRLRLADSANAYEDLKHTIADQQKVVEAMAQNLQDYKEKKSQVALDSRKDIVNDTLKAVNAEATRIAQRLSDAQIRRDQVAEHRAKGIPLTELSFIATQPTIVTLLQKRSEQIVLVSSMKERYRAKWPAMIEAVNTLDQYEKELQKAIDGACGIIEADYQSALRENQQIQEKLTQQKNESLDLDRYALDYTNRERELNLNIQVLNSMAARAKETSIAGSFSTQNARVVDAAQPAADGRPISPNVPLNLGFGVLGGLGLGFAFAFFVAFIDDRVKSSFDIEGVVGLPLVGIIPQIKRMDQVDKAQIVVNNADRQVSEAFLTLHSSLRLKDESKNAKAILITSTIPGEGKSFTTTNLALTFAAHGEKVIIVDCDLRKPNIHKSFKIENLRGLIDICAGTAKLEDVVVHSAQANLDILPAGGRAKNPTQILNSKSFELLISDLKKKYDRVMIDTPPLAAVSDALIILPLMDGSLFTIYFNKVRRKAAQFSAKRLLDANVPNFGAVLNGLNLAVSGYYYAQYYDKSYKDYYVVMSKKDGGDPEK